MHLTPLVTADQQINEACKKMNYTVPRYKKKLPHYHGNKKNKSVSYLTIALILIPKKGRPSARRLPLEWGSGEGVTEASLTPVNMQGGCFEPRTWCSVGELLTNCTKPALHPYYLKMNKLYSGEGRFIRSILLQINSLPNHNDEC